MDFTRRETLAIGAGAALMTVLPFRANAAVDDLINEFTGGAALGDIEETFAATLTPGDTFLIGGQVVRYERLRDMIVEVSRAPNGKPKVATFNGTMFSASTQLSQRMLAMYKKKETK